MIVAIVLVCILLSCFACVALCKAAGEADAADRRRQ